jgi:hypothetical protein
LILTPIDDDFAAHVEAAITPPARAQIMKRIIGIIHAE